MRIQEGGFGFDMFSKRHDLLKGDTLAMKKIKIHPEEGTPSQVIREVSLLKQLQHKNIIRLVDIFSSDDSIDLVFESPDYDLKHFIRSQSRTAGYAYQRKKYLHQILHGLAYCHAHKIFIRDLQPENLLIDHDNDLVKIAEFGLAGAVGFFQEQDIEAVEDVNLLGYTAPEILYGSRQYSTSIDIWAVGCIFAEMVTNITLFRGSTDETQLFMIFRIIGGPDPEIKLCGYKKFSEKYSKKFSDLFGEPLTFAGLMKPQGLAKEVPGLEPAGLDLLNKMLCLDPNKRITAREALEHEYFKDFHDNCFGTTMQLYGGILVGASKLKASICG